MFPHGARILQSVLCTENSKKKKENPHKLISCVCAAEIK